MREKTSISERRTCQGGLSRTVLHYVSGDRPENAILQGRIVELAQKRRRFGCRRIHALLRRESVKANHKRVFRLYQEAGLAVRRRRKRYGVAVEREKLTKPSMPNAVWSMDFVSDALAGGRRTKALTIVDDFTKESVDIVVDHGIWLLCDSCAGSGSTLSWNTCCDSDRPRARVYGHALDQWACRNGVQLKLNEPCKPTQNAYIESFNGRFRDECLNEHWFTSLAGARD